MFSFSFLLTCFLLGLSDGTDLNRVYASNFGRLVSLKSTLAGVATIFAGGGADWFAAKGEFEMARDRVDELIVAGAKNSSFNEPAASDGPPGTTPLLKGPKHDPGGPARQDFAGAVSKAAGTPYPAVASTAANVEPYGGGALGDLAAMPPLPSGWACDHHGTGRHSVFGSYRVATEGMAGNGLIKKLADAIEERGLQPGSTRTSTPVFWDTRCLNAGESWELGLKNGLEGASLVLPLVSAAALQIMVEHAATRRDNLLMEWEIALERQRLGLCLVLPIFIHDFNAGGQPRPVNLNEASYPEAPHRLSGISIRATIAALSKIQGVKLVLDRSGAPDPAQLANAVLQVRRLLGSAEVRTMQLRAQQAYGAEQWREAVMWKRVEAIINGGDWIGPRTPTQCVVRGKLQPHEPGELPVAVKILGPDAFAADKQLGMTMELLKGLEVRPGLRS